MEASYPVGKKAAGASYPVGKGGRGLLSLGKGGRGLLSRGKKAAVEAAAEASYPVGKTKSEIQQFFPGVISSVSSLSSSRHSLDDAVTLFVWKIDRIPKQMFYGQISNAQMLGNRSKRLG